MNASNIGNEVARAQRRPISESVIEHSGGMLAVFGAFLFLLPLASVILGGIVLLAISDPREKQPVLATVTILVVYAFVAGLTVFLVRQHFNNRHKARFIAGENGIEFSTIPLFGDATRTVLYDDISELYFGTKSSGMRAVQALGGRKGQTMAIVQRMHLSIECKSAGRIQFNGIFNLFENESLDATLQYVCSRIGQAGVNEY